MGHLDRYKKSGGFIQLLTLIESFPSQKQEKFIALIDEENPTWAKTLREKVLTMARILSWPAPTLSEIVPVVPMNIFAIALHGLKPEQVEYFLSGLPQGEKRKIQNEFDVLKPNSNEIATTHQKLIDAVRKMVNEGSLRLEVIDPTAVVDEKVEERLLQASTFVRGESETMDSQTLEVERGQDLVKEAVQGVQGVQSQRGVDGQKLVQEIKSLQALVVNLQKENKLLKGDLKIYKDKIEAIKKIA